MKKAAIITCFVLGVSTLYGQTEETVIRLDEFKLPSKRNIIHIPNVNGHLVLKCDFHMHTVFSDGHVWPNVRVQEAWQEGLDAISLTEHMEYQPNKDNVSTDHNRSYELAVNLAKENNLLLIKGTEVTRNTPPGHFNALFIGDANKYVDVRDENLDQESLDRVNKDGAFVFWNHPGWKATQIKGSYEWLPFIEKQYQEKKIQGIEVVNGLGFHSKALDWGLDRNLTIIGNTDMHNLMAHTYDLGRDGVHRTMTLVMAKERSPEGIREALNSGRTVAWSSKYLFGKEEHIKAIYDACVSLSPVYHEKSNAKGAVTKYYEIRNNSDLYFELKLKEGKGTKSIILYPESAQILTADAKQKVLTYEVVSTYIRSDKHLSVTINLN